MEYKFGKDVLVEIMSIVQEGLTNRADVSQLLRDVRLTALSIDDDDELELVLSEPYLTKRGRKN